MARPTKPKDIKPKVEGEIAALPGGAPAGGGLDLKFIIMIAIILISTSLTSAASVYFLAPMVIMPPIEQKLAKLNAGGEEGEHGKEGQHGDSHAQKVGMNLELDEFTVNLKEDPALGGSQYLRSKMSLNISVPEAEDCYALQQHHATLYPQTLPGGGHVIGAAIPVTTTNPVDRTQLASGGGSVDPVAACLAAFKGNMAKFVPTMRDVINAALMKRTAGTLSTLEGQEALKDEIKESINQFMGEHYQVVRVNFEDFIIQK